MDVEGRARGLRGSPKSQTSPWNIQTSPSHDQGAHPRPVCCSRADRLCAPTGANGLVRRGFASPRKRPRPRPSVVGPFASGRRMKNPTANPPPPSPRARRHVAATSPSLPRPTPQSARALRRSAQSSAAGRQRGTADLSSGAVHGSRRWPRSTRLDHPPPEFAQTHHHSPFPPRVSSASRSFPVRAAAPPSLRGDYRGDL